ncbi:MAG: large conductance mechanosensitive channel protein MscL [Kineosporiaceae bacterium]
MIKGFREFLMRGNVVDLAVAVVIGGAFAKVVEGLLNGLINPLIAAVFGSPNLDNVGTFDLNGAHFSIGVLLTALINFVIIAGAIYFFVVTPMQRVMARVNRNKEEAAAETPADVALLTEIRDLLRTNR